MYCCLYMQKTAYDIRISDWSSDVCSSDLLSVAPRRQAILGIGLYPLEILAHDEVDDARHGVGPIDGRSAAGHHFDPLDQRGREHVEVAHAVRRIRNEALAVDKHQRALLAGAAKVDRGRALIAVVGSAAQGCTRLRTDRQANQNPG